MDTQKEWEDTEGINKISLYYDMVGYKKKA